ncbi:hypothetical protein [Natrinema salsiterrestre]
MKILGAPGAYEVDWWSPESDGAGNLWSVESSTRR